MVQAVSSGVWYFLIAFAAGFVMGSVRVLLLAPRIGELAAVLIELPVMLAISWAAARGLIRRLGVSRDLSARAIMAVVGFGLLMLAEGLLGRLAFGRPLSVQIAAVGTWPGALGLTGQVVFGLIPLFVLRSRS